MKKTIMAVMIFLLLVILVTPWNEAHAVTDGLYNLAEVTATWDGTDTNRTKLPSADYNYTYGDEAAVTYTLPWSFSFYGQSYNQITADTNGNIWFNSTNPAKEFNLASTGHGPVIASWNTDLSSYFYGGVFIQHKTNPERVVIEWQTETYTEEGENIPNDLEVVIFNNGAVRFDYKSFSTAAGKDFGSGISKGDGSSFINISNVFGNAFTLGGRSFLATDNAHPSVTVTPVTSPSNVTSQTISGTMSGSTLTVAVDTSATVGPITFPTSTTWSCTLSSLVEGANNITLTATDAVGNQATSTIVLVIDTTPPAVQITSPLGHVYDPATLLYSVTDGAVTVTVDGKSVLKTSGDVLDSLPAGNHVLRVEARDAAGNTGFAESAFTIDGTQPVVKIISPTAGNLTNRRPLLVYSVSTGTPVVTVDGVAVATISGQNLPSLSDGSHTVRVQTSNGSGQAASAEVVFTVLGPPQVTISSPVTGLTNNASPLLLYSVSSGTPTVMVDGLEAGTVSGAPLDPLSEGKHIVQVKAVNDSGLMGFANVAFMVDTIPPALLKPLTIASVTALAAGTEHIVEVKIDGTIWAWGKNDQGQIGDGTTDMKTAPVQIGEDMDWVAAAAGKNHTLALKSDGTLWAWGNNDSGQLGDGTANSKPRPIKVGTDTDWLSIAAGNGFTLAIKKDGTCWAWGDNSNGQLGDGTTVARNLPTQIGTDADWNTVAANGSQTVALKNDGTLWAWGGPNTSPTLVGSDNDWLKIAAGISHALALKQDGSLWAWGDNASGQIGDGTTDFNPLPVMVGTDYDWAAIAAGGAYSIALKSDGTLWAWGDNGNGQLGNGTANQQMTPTQVGTDTIWSALTSGASFAAAVKTDGTMWSWGANGSGQLANGTTDDQYSPVQIGMHGVGIYINNGINYTDSQTIFLKMNAFDLNGVSVMQFSNNNVDWSDPEPYTTLKRWTLSEGIGDKTVYVKFKDNAGNWSSAFSYPITLANSALSSVLYSPASGVANSNDNLVLKYDAPADCTVVVKVDGNIVSKVSGDTLGPLSDGTHVVQISVTDRGGCTKTSVMTIVVDTTPPALFLNQVASPTTSASQLLGGTMASGSTIAVSVNTSATVGPVTYPTATSWSCPVTGLTAGVNTITVTAIDVYGSRNSIGTVINYQIPNQVPSITSANNTSFSVGTPGSFIVTTTGYPVPTLTHTGSLPAGVSFNDATGALAGTPAAGTGGTYLLNITANNGVTPSAVQTFTLTVNQAPAITSAPTTSFSIGTPGSFTVAATGYPPPVLSHTGSLPAGVTFSDVTGTLSGNPAAGTAGIYNLTIIANNNIGLNAVQSFTLTVNLASPGVPGAPTGVAAVAGNGQATVSFTAPASNGGSAITGYTVISSPGNITATGSASPITVTGLTNGTAYTFTVSATNVIGTGSSSTPSTPVIPTSPPNSKPTVATGSASNIAQNGATLLGTVNDNGAVTSVMFEYGTTTAYGTTLPAGTVAAGAGSTEVAANLTGLACNSVYHYLVSATNSAGTATCNDQTFTTSACSAFYTIISSVSNPAAGTITPSGTTSVISGGSITFTITPSSGYTLTNLRDNSVTVTPAAGPSGTFTYTITNVTANHIVHATFMLSTASSAMPMITYFTPSNGATSIDPTSTVTATFSKDMNPETMTTGSFVVSRFVGIKQVSAGSAFTAALKNDGTVVAWGDNSVGQTMVPSGLTGVTAIAAGSNFTVALKSDGTVAAWGDNNTGETSIPVGLTGVIAIAAGYSHAVALKSNGTVVAWGNSYFGATTVPAGLTGVIAIAAGGNFTLALKNNGTVVAWGYNAYGQATVPAGLTGVTAISAGIDFAVALKNDGTVVAWGYNGSGQTTVPAGLTGVTAIAAGYDFTVALKNNSTVVAWGNNGSGQTTVPAGLAGVTAITAGESYTVALKSDGTVVAWGNTTVPAGLTGVAAIAASSDYAVALKNDGTVAAWGDGEPTVPNGLTGVTSIAAGINYTLALKSDGTVVALGSYPDGGSVTVPSGLIGVTAIAAGDVHALALLSNGTVVAWGDNNAGETTVPSGLTGVIAIAAGGYYYGDSEIDADLNEGGHSVALKNDGTVVAWGQNASGQAAVPGGLTGVTAIAAGPYHTVALKSDGTVVAWGDNSSGETTVPGGLTGATAIAAGGYYYEDDSGNQIIAGHTVALKSDGTVVAWGDNTYGQTAIPAGLTGVIAIAAGDNYNLALKSDGTIVAWGSSSATTIPSAYSVYDNAVGGTVTYSPDNLTTTFMPTTPLTGGTYNVTVAGPRSVAGVPLATQTKWSFSVQ